MASRERCERVGRVISSSGEAIGREDDPIDLTFIYRLEAGKDMLIDKGRRAILARLVDMPLAIACIDLMESVITGTFVVEDRIDTKEYADTLGIYCDTWQQGTTYSERPENASIPCFWIKNGVCSQ
jgi:hypothetical protein